MKRRKDLEHNAGRAGPTAPMEEDLNRLHSAYRRAFDEYAQAAFIINDCIRRHIPLSAEAFVRRRSAYVALLDTGRAVCEARRGQTMQEPKTATRT